MIKTSLILGTIFVWLAIILGAFGIAYATVISFMVEKTMLAIYCKMQGIKFSDYTPVREYAIFSSLTLIAFVCSLYLI